MKTKLQQATRRVICLTSVAAAMLPGLVAAQVAGYPSKPIRVIGPFAAGGPVELLARAITQRVVEPMGQPFIVENRGGASGTIGTDLVARAAKDGYTMLISNCSHTSNVAYYKKLPYDPVADFAAITQFDVTSGNLLIIHPSVPVRSVKELIALARKQPSQLKYASAGIGSPQHVTGALFAAMAGIEFVHVPYKGNPPAFSDVVGGHVEMLFSSPSVPKPYLKEGRLRALGLAGKRRLPWLPEVPTFDEAGLTGYEYVCWHGAWFPTGTPPEIVRRMNAELVKAVATPEVRKYLAEWDYFATATTPEEFTEFLKKDVVRQAEIARMVGIQPQ